MPSAVAAAQEAPGGQGFSSPPSLPVVKKSRGALEASESEEGLNEGGFGGFTCLFLGFSAAGEKHRRIQHQLRCDCRSCKRTLPTIRRVLGVAGQRGGPMEESEDSKTPRAMVFHQMGLWRSQSPQDLLNLEMEETLMTERKDSKVVRWFHREEFWPLIPHVIKLLGIDVSQVESDQDVVYLIMVGLRSPANAFPFHKSVKLLVVDVSVSVVTKKTTIPVTGSFALEDVQDQKLEVHLKRILGVSALTPRTFTKVVVVLKVALQKERVLVPPYLDDWLILAKPADLSQLAVQWVLERLRALGWVVNLAKSQLMPSQSLLYLGARFNTWMGKIMEALHRLKAEIPDCSAALELLRRGILTEEELEPEISADQLKFPKGTGHSQMLSWLNINPTCEKKETPRKTATANNKAKNSKLDWDVFQHETNERYLDDNEYDEFYETQENWVKSKFAYIVPPESSDADSWILSQLGEDDIINEEELREIRRLWNMDARDRWRLYRKWMQSYERKLQQALVNKLEEYEEQIKARANLTLQENQLILQRALIIGMTTTGAAKYRRLLQKIKPRIVVVEEAAEVLEAHVLTTLTTSCQHLIMIGDHQQLRPKPADYTLEKKYHLGISLFERMVNNKIPFVQLQYQHRMRPEISQLLVPLFYRNLQDHTSVTEYEPIKVSIDKPPPTQSRKR
ncbi:uncharacterized protein LOC115081394 [Rhinatrema bivittatum]|uniref:uncharacterized protein LOC115081394 n=1 Tax=Rhinatrema bivittatum TaxID=194408 RepID=UPI00112C7607|nr:uncharacterized protein LOC115081394 [Rhinatrema bivittatum]